ncbi:MULTISPECIES: DUF3344 domain-containing protein [unclassified Streptomyces]|uniref:DUF3344 domain-containing protein n=1 Tax=Streptomyces TaxID=1883 RepID=UPI001908AC7F|nr:MULTISPECIES: DUF3344 domain-containing protein [unclassified Streptomyces]MCU4747819.1 DUF3344 domain-containing protein [Streptomyces sp. G-5]QQN78436.1 DUF3344 domain-containing protein [Streptomyces sp. XC 2026]
MRFSVGFGKRAVVCALSALLLSIGVSQHTAVPAPSDRGEAETVPFAERYHAVQHGGIARAANSVITCGAAVTITAPACTAVQREGAGGRSGQYEMTYIDIDSDRNTYNSSSADLRLPQGSRVSYARLYWGANLRVGEQKPPADNDRVLVAEPGGRYKEIRADSVVGHRDAEAHQGFSASADITELVRWSQPGAWTVAQINVAMGNSDMGAWGGWTLVVAYENPAEPLRELAIWDGFESVDGPGTDVVLTLDGLNIAEGAEGSVGVVGYHGERTAGGHALTVRAQDGATVRHRALDSTIADHGRNVTGRDPAYVNTLGYDSNVLDVTDALGAGPGELELRFTGGSRPYQLGAVFFQADARE